MASLFISKKWRFGVILCLILAVALLLSACGTKETGSQETESQEQESATTETEVAKPYYQDKSIEIIVPFAAGGGTDLYARFVAPYLEKYIEGNPKIVITNMAGGESITGANWFVANAKPDGLMMLGTSASTTFPAQLGRTEVKYDFNNLSPVIFTPTGGVLYGSMECGDTLEEQLKNPKKPLVYGGIGATGLDLIPLLAFEVLGLDVKSVLGFEGRGPARLAMERGETTLDYQTSTAYLTNVIPMVEDKKALPLVSFGVVNQAGELERDPVFPEIPTLDEVYQQLNGTAPSGPAWEAYVAFVASGCAYQKAFWVLNGTPQEAIDALSQAVEKMAQDPEFNEKGKEILGGYPSFVGKDMEEAARKVMIISPDVQKWVVDLLTTKYNTKF